MTQVFLTDLDQALAHLDPIEIGPVPYDPTFATSWRDRGRPPSTGDFVAEGILCHHTASPLGVTTEADLQFIITGSGDAPGPISQLYLSRAGDLFIVAAGRANHGGSGVIPGESAATSMNARLLGIEVANDGVGEPWSDVLCDRYAATVAALIDFYGWPLDMVLLHWVTGQPAGNFKIDPAGPWALQPDLPGGGAGSWSLELWRGFVNDHRGSGPPPPPSKGDLVLTIFQCSDAWAGFLGLSVGGVGQLVEWVDGPTAAYYKSLGAVEQSITVEQCAGFSLMGPLPQGDGAHQWTGGEFRRLIL